MRSGGVYKGPAAGAQGGVAMDDVLRSLLFIGAPTQELPQELAKGGYATFTYESAVETDKTVMWYMYVKIKKIETSCRDEGANEGWYTLEHGPLRRSLNGEVPSCGDVTPTTVQPFKMGVADKKMELQRTNSIPAFSFTPRGGAQRAFLNLCTSTC